ncbi:Meiosis inhibitor protein 1, partial [Ophiophagus hannah]
MAGFASEPSVCERFHSRHDPHWLLEFLPSPLCLACAIETLKEDGVSMILTLYTSIGILHIVEDSSIQDLLIEGLLKQLLKYDNFVLIIMSFTGKGADSASPELFEGDSLLPLILKKLLLSRDEILQVASTQCMAAILVYSPAKYAPAFIQADIPEFLFECLFCMSESLTWSVYCCLLLLTEEQLFFSKCHTVYGIEPFIKSLKETLHLNNIELQKQGLLLFTEILKKQPEEIKLFTNIATFKDAVSVLMEAVKCPVIEVASEAVKAVTAILRKDHVSFPPIQYGQLQNLIETILIRCNDLPLAPFNKRLMDHQGGRCKNTVISQQAQFLQNALESFRNACSLAVQYQKDPLAQKNTFTAPNSENIDTLKRFSEFLLWISDSLCIPLVMKYSERAVRPGIMEVFISALSILFNVMPDMHKRLSIKM